MQTATARPAVTLPAPIPLASDDTRPSHGARHPIALCFHSINNAAQIATLAAEHHDGMFAVDARRITELLCDAALHLLRVKKLLDSQEKVLEQLRTEQVREIKYAAAVEAKNSELTQAKIDLTHQVAELQHLVSGFRSAEMAVEG